MKIHISHSTKVLLESAPYHVVERGKIEIKGKGEMKTYFVLYKVDMHGNPIKSKFMEVLEKYSKNKAVTNEAARKDSSLSSFDQTPRPNASTTGFTLTNSSSFDKTDVNVNYGLVRKQQQPTTQNCI